MVVIMARADRSVVKYNTNGGYYGKGRSFRESQRQYVAEQSEN
jgi:hypothetical protein